MLYFIHLQSIELHNCGDDGGLGWHTVITWDDWRIPISQPLTLQKHLDHFNHIIFRLSQLHQCDQRNVIKFRFSEELLLNLQ